MLASKVALITGAAQGIGLAATRLLLRNGARVSMLDINESVGRSSCSSLQKEFSAGDVMFTAVDVTRSEELAAAFEQTNLNFGGIDIVLNNAGIGDELRWKKMVDINLVAVIEGTRLGVKYMSTKNGGRGGTVINVASMGGLILMPFAPVYAGTKHGVVGFSRSLRDLALTDDVRVNCICPEFADTAIVRDNVATISEEVRSFIKEMGLLTPEKVAEGILELATDTSKVGAVMTVTLKRGIDYYQLLGDPKITKSKL